jgi:hypothetical protein
MKQKGARRLDATDDAEEQGTPIFFVASPDVLAALGMSTAANHPPMRPCFATCGRTVSASATTKPRYRARTTFCTWARRAGKDDAWTKTHTGHSATSKMLDRYTRMAVTLADLDYEPFPDVTEAIHDLAKAARSCARLPQELPQNGPATRSAKPQDSPQPGGIIECEGRDLNPHASYGASTSTVDARRDLSRFACFLGPPGRRLRPLAPVWGLVDNEVDNAGAQSAHTSRLLGASSGIA